MMIKIVDSNQASWVKSSLHNCASGKLLTFPGLGVLIGDIIIGQSL